MRDKLTSYEFIVCPTCGVEKSKPFLGKRDIVVCRKCGLIYVNPRLCSDETESFFKQVYIPDGQMLRQEFGEWRKETLRREQRLINTIKKPGRILDVGCAGGEFLKFFNSGWECSGIEPSTIASEEARQKGVHIYGGTIKDAELPKNYFDVISFLDMLYFDPTPLDDIDEATQALKDDGLLVIELPGFTYRILRKFGPLSLIINRRWNDFSSTSPHLFYFSTSSLRRLLEKAGLHIIGMVPEAAPLRGPVVLQLINKIYFAFSKILFMITFGKINVAAKVIYLCQKS